MVCSGFKDGRKGRGLRNTGSLQNLDEEKEMDSLPETLEDTAFVTS